MGLGSTAKKLQRTIDVVEDLYGKMNDIRERMAGMEETVDETNDRVAAVETELAEQRAVVEALADDRGIDVDAVTAAAADASAADDDAVADASADGND